MKAYQFIGATFNTTPIIQSTVQTSSGNNPGGTLTISSSGNTDSTGIVWASMTISGDEDHGLTSGILRAINAVTGAELWNSQMVPSRDSEGAYLAKFVSPLVINGKVYMATFTDYSTTNSVVVYGLLTASPQFTLAVTPSSQAIVPGGASAALAVSVSPLSGHSFTGAVNLSVTGLPSGVTGTFSPGTVSGAGTSTLTLTASASAALGQSMLTITGKGAKSGFTATSTVKLTVTNQAGGISVNFVGNGTPLNSADVAGVAAKAQWNNITGFSGTAPALTDEFGNATTVSMTYSGENPWELPITATTPNEVMMQGYLDDQDAGATTVTFSGLLQLPSGYTVYVYADGDNTTSLRAGSYVISGAGITTQTVTIADLPNTNFSGTFKQASSSTPAGNYAVFSVPGGSFTLTATPTVSARAPVNGIQIIPN